MKIKLIYLSLRSAMKILKKLKASHCFYTVQQIIWDSQKLIAKLIFNFFINLTMLEFYYRFQTLHDDSYNSKVRFRKCSNPIIVTKKSVRQFEPFWYFYWLLDELGDEETAAMLEELYCVACDKMFRSLAAKVRHILNRPREVGSGIFVRFKMSRS